MKAYVTLLSTNEYLDGVLALYQSLKDVGSQYPLVVALTNKIFPHCRTILKELRIETIELKDFSFSKTCEKKLTNFGAPHWIHTAGKLQIFGLTQFEKIVYLDADMFVLKNIDHLFDCPHLSATQDSPMIYNEDKDKHLGLNSGVMVIEPSKKKEKELKELSYKNLMPDQELINLYYSNWKNEKELHLPITYNILAPYLNQYYQHNVSLFDIHIIHFIGRIKPFHKNIQSYSLKTYYEYFEGLYLTSITRAIDSLKNND